MLAQLAERRIPYISILTNPTTGGVSASYAMLGDAILAEPGAVIGFAGPRVIKQTLGQDLPEGFQTSEFLLDHGMLDSVLHRAESQAYRQPTAAPHVRPSCGDGVGVALTVPSQSVANQPQLADYRDALDYLFARTTGGFKFGLERTTALLAALGNPERRYPALHVAGTNGKGSSVATMAALLAAKGLRVATYTSPHLVDFRERMVVAGELIPADDVVEFIATHLPLIEEIGASFFEATTAMAFDYFARAQRRRRDHRSRPRRTARLDERDHPVVAGVTSIGLDHTEYLGSTLEEIAGEKAGIFKPGRARRDRRARSADSRPSRRVRDARRRVEREEPADEVRVRSRGRRR